MNLLKLKFSGKTQSVSLLKLVTILLTYNYLL